MIDLNKWSPSDYAAWWGAIVATIIAIWEFLKWIGAGAKLKINIYYWEENEGLGFRLIIINVGDAPASVEDMSLKIYRKKFLFFRFYETDIHRFSYVGGEMEMRLPPFLLSQGENWESSIYPPNDFKYVPKNNANLFLFVSESHRKKPYIVKVKVEKFLGKHLTTG